MGAQIQAPSSAGAYFVLPSQLNGAEYPDSDWVVTDIADYRSDNTGGPRGQLAVHPAAGQFVLDNAANVNNEGGISAVDQIVKDVPEFKLLDGYLTLPSTSDEKDGVRLFDAFTSRLHTLRPLIMHDVPASGLVPDKRGVSQAKHRVGLVYASAVPVNSYQNNAKNEVEKRLHLKTAEAVLVAQYFGALRAVAQEALQSGAKPVTVFLMPLGGGVFNNPWKIICRAMAQAAELLAAEPALFDAVQIEALAWQGNPAEARTLQKLLSEHGKLLDKQSE